MSQRAPTVSVLFVCMGNICRSPTAHAVFRRRVADAGLADRIRVESAGTHGFHVGQGPDRRAREAARQRGYDLSDIVARRIEPGDLYRFDYVIAMDRANLAEVQRLAATGGRAELGLFLDYGGGSGGDVPDPYYGAINGFEEVLDLVEESADTLLAHLRQHHRLLGGGPGKR